MEKESVGDLGDSRIKPEREQRETWQGRLWKNGRRGRNLSEGSPATACSTGALTEFMPKAIIAYEENRKHLSGLRDQIGEADNELKRLKTSITDADGKLGEAGGD